MISTSSLIILYLSKGLPLIVISPDEVVIEELVALEILIPPAEAVKSIASEPVPADVNNKLASKAPVWEIVRSSAALSAACVIV